MKPSEATAKEITTPPTGSPIRYERRFTESGQDPFRTVEWGRRDAEVGSGESRFFQSDVEAPASWSDASVSIVAKLYFATVDGIRESSIRQVITRVVGKIVVEMKREGYFAESNCLDVMPDLSGFWSEDAIAFHDELVYLLLHQYVTFNSPVWFNFGVPGRLQCGSACFLLSVEDRMNSSRDVPTGEGDAITDWWAKEAKIFKMGAGAGVNVSNIRGSMEPLSTGGVASGPVAYIWPSDAGAGTLKSGGAHRRAAKLVRLDADHPDILDFIECKVREDARMRALQDSGFNLDPTTPEGERNIAECTSFQNQNISVGVTDEFMRQATEQPDLTGWHLTARKTGDIVDTVSAAGMLSMIADAAHRCADPGIQFHDEINRWHTTPSLGPITTSNPCLPGDALVDTSEGRIPIARLTEMYATGERLPMAFAWDTEQTLPVLRQIRRAWLTKMVDQLVIVKTTKGAVIHCTPDHQILTREGGRGPDGSYIQAGDLQPGDRLRKIARWVNDHRSERRCINHRETEEFPGGTVYQSRFMWEQAFGSIPDQMDVHHLNEDPTDDRLSNFELVDAGPHQSLHSTAERNGRFIDASEETLVEFWEECEQLPRVRSKKVTETRWNLHVKRCGLVGKIPMSNGHGRIRGMWWGEFEAWIEERRSLVNDSVASVHVLNLQVPIPVYDLEVEGTYNFAVATEGVEHTIIVHNCAETVLNDNSSCNLGTLNIGRFVADTDGVGINVDDLRHAVDIMVTAMDSTCSWTDLPTEQITDNTRKLRQLGLGYTNLGGALMVMGMPYDSDLGRDFAAGLSALMTGRAYRRSAELAHSLGAFEHYAANEPVMRGVLERHRAMLPNSAADGTLWLAAMDDWADASRKGQKHGYRNSQVTLVQPGGTTSFMVGADTTGIEPAFSLVVYKKLAAGGVMKTVNGAVSTSLRKLGYSELVIDKVADVLHEDGALRDVEELNPEHLGIFQTAVGADSIPPIAHVAMVAAVQPFLSQSVSKTINVPEESTASDIRELYVEAWRRGLKAISVYRDGSKATQILSAKASNPRVALERLDRRRMPRVRTSVTSKFSIDGHEGYLTAGMHENGDLGEIFLNGIGKDGSTLRGMMDAWAVAISIGFQYGVPLEVYARKYAHVKFEPSGVTNDPAVPTATSLPDYIMRSLAGMFLDVDACEELGVLTAEVKKRKTEMLDAVMTVAEPTPGSDLGVACKQCGSMMVRTGNCWTCSGCFANTGCG